MSVISEAVPNVEEELMQSIALTARCTDPAELLYGAAADASSSSAADLLAAPFALPPLELDTPISSSAAAGTDATSSSSSTLLATPPTPVADPESLLAARRIASVAHLLGRAVGPRAAAELSPRAHLLAIMEALRVGLFVAFPPALQEAVPLNGTGGPGGSVVSGVPQLFRLHASTRAVGTGAMWAGLYTLTYPSARLRVELACGALRERLRAELASPALDGDPEALVALMVTQTLLEDLTELYHNLLLAIPMHAQLLQDVIAGPSAALRSAAAAASPLTLSAPSVARLAETLRRYYYRLADWVLLVESTVEARELALTRATALSLDERRGVVGVQLRRPSADSPWGLLLSDDLRLVDVDAALRVHERMDTLHRLLGAAAGGAAIVSVDGVALPKPGAAAYRAALQEAFGASAAGRHKRLALEIQAPEFRSASRHRPTDVAFYTNAPAAAATDGQPHSAALSSSAAATGARASLVLRRSFRDVDWGFRVGADGFAFVPPPAASVSLPDARAFFQRYRRRLRLAAVNGVAVRSLAQVEALVETAELVLLDVVVTAHTIPLPTKAAVAVAAADHEAHRPELTEPTPAAAAATLEEEEEAIEETEEAEGAQPQEEEEKVDALANNDAPLVENLHAVEAAAVAAASLRKKPSAKHSVESGSAKEKSKTNQKAQSIAAAEKEATTVIYDPEEEEAADPLPLTDSRNTPGGVDEAAARIVAEMQQQGQQQTLDKAEAEAEALPAKTKASPKPKKLSKIEEAVAAVLEADYDMASASEKAPAKAVKSSKKASVAPSATDDEVQNIIDSLKSSGDDGVEKKKKKSKAASSSTSAAVTTSDAPPPPPLEFANGVRLVRLTPTEMVWERPSAATPWGIHLLSRSDPSMNPGGLPVQVTELPPLPAGLTAAQARKLKAHPFFKTFGTDPGSWFVAKVNNKPANSPSTVVSSMKKNVKMTLKFLR